MANDKVYANAHDKAFAIVYCSKYTGKKFTKAEWEEAEKILAAKPIEFVDYTDSHKSIHLDDGLADGFIGQTYEDYTRENTSAEGNL